MRELTASGEALLRVATDVYYAEGIQATGVDVIAQHAGVSKPTLYAQFGSKDNLVAAVLERRRAERQAALSAQLASLEGSAGERLLAVFDWLASGHRREGFRGCPFTNAAVELVDRRHPARKVIAGYKEWLRKVFVDLATEVGLDDPETIGTALLMLVDGANARVVVFGDREAMLQAKAAAVRLIGHRDPSGGRRAGGETSRSGRCAEPTETGRASRPGRKERTS